MLILHTIKTHRTPRPTKRQHRQHLTCCLSLIPIAQTLFTSPVAFSSFALTQMQTKLQPSFRPCGVINSLKHQLPTMTQRCVQFVCIYGPLLYQPPLHPLSLNRERGSPHATQLTYKQNQYLKSVNLQEVRNQALHPSPAHPCRNHSWYEHLYSQEDATYHTTDCSTETIREVVSSSLARICNPGTEKRGRGCDGD